MTLPILSHGEFKVEPLIAELSPRNETIHAFSNHDKVRKVFQHYNTVPLRTGIGRMSEWIKSNGKATPIEFENIEVESLTAFLEKACLIGIHRCLETLMSTPSYAFAPRYLSGKSSWTGHLPFAYDLVKCLRPALEWS